MSCCRVPEVRLTASVDEALMALCVGAWCNWLAEYKKNKQFEDSVKAAENKVKDSWLEQIEVHSKQSET